MRHCWESVEEEEASRVKSPCEWKPGVWGNTALFSSLSASNHSLTEENCQDVSLIYLNYIIIAGRKPWNLHINNLLGLF